jgi:acyl carrier protein
MSYSRPSTLTSDVAVREEILRRLSRVTPGTAVVLTDDMALNELGIGSLDLLEIIDALETSLASNPFEGRLSPSDIRTVGDLYAAYRPPVDGARSGNVLDELLTSSRKRAEARRRGRQP